MRNRSELFKVIICMIVNGLLWFLLLPALWAVILVGITSVAFALSIAAWFDILDKRRAKIRDTSDKQEAP
jgi:membrane protein implicated in regulation of membrane protease activity